VRILARLAPLVFVAALLAAWEAAARSGRWSPLLFPSLERIAAALAQLLSSSERLGEALLSLERALGGFALAAVAGIVIGMAMGRSRVLAGLLDPLFSGTYAVPKLALFPVFIFVFGIGSLSKVALVFLECLYPIVIMTSHGALAGAPWIFAGLRIAAPVAMIVVVITEMIGSADGLGYLVMYSLSSLRTDRVLATVIVIAALGYALDRLLVLARNRLVYWEKLHTYYV